MSRSKRRFRKWESETRLQMWDDARQLALDLYHGRAGGVSHYGIGVALQPGEVLFREVWARYATLGAPPQLIDPYGVVRLGLPQWHDWGWCHTLVTSLRLVTRITNDGGRLISNWWSGVAGVQINLADGVVAMDDHAGEWRGMFVGPAAPVIAVTAVAQTHGVADLLDHPGLAMLRSDPAG